MIFVDRAAGPEPNAVWFAAAAAKTTQARADGPAHVVDDDTYGHAQVRMALEVLFRQKCAYCESWTTATSAWDVEHFRPKKAVKESPAHTGYFWLAYTWANLYLSCQFCNQRRRDQPTLGEPTLGPAQGKLDQFPLSDETTRAMLPDDNVDGEARLLIDPCADDPEDHVTFGVKGQLEPVGGSAMGASTRDVCNLNRRRLREARQTWALFVVGVIGNMRALAPTVPLDTVLANVRVLHGAPNLPYAGVTRAICRDPIAFGIA
jgi:hypothetical protein